MELNFFPVKPVTTEISSSKVSDKCKTPYTELFIFSNFD